MLLFASSFPSSLSRARRILRTCYLLLAPVHVSNDFLLRWHVRWLISFSILSPVLLFKRLETADGELVVDVKEKE